MVPSPPLSPLNKAALRQEMLAARRSFEAALKPEKRAALELALADALGTLLDEAEIIGGYRAFDGEISPAAALARAAAGGKTIAYPAFEKRGSLFQYLAGAPVEIGPWGTLQPPLDARVVAPDLILVPLVAVDLIGTRIGRGKGHYDRVLAAIARSAPTLIGIGWANQRLDTLIPADNWDMRLHGFASPQGFETFR